MSSLVHGPIVGAFPRLEASEIGAALLSTPHAGASVPLPTGFPAELGNDLAWSGSDFKNDDSYIYRLTAKDVGEIGLALDHFKGLGLDGAHVSRSTFPLPNLCRELSKLAHDLHHGRGFCLVRGIKPEDYCVEDLTLVHLGIQAHIAEQRGRQDSRGNMLVHIVADNTSKTRADHHRHSNKSITFHNEESGDIVGWLTRNTASQGGRCIIASAYTVYNVLAANQPHLVRLLARSDWPFAFPHFQCRPILFYENSRLVMNFGRTALLGSAIHPRPENLPSITAQQLEALDAVEAIAKATQLEIQTQAGDMHFINNLAILHRREGFVDGATAVEKRHLVRMRLRSSQLGWKLPRELEDEWERAFGSKGNRVWYLEPMPDAFFPLRKYPN